VREEGKTPGGENAFVERGKTRAFAGGKKSKLRLRGKRGKKISVKRFVTLKGKNGKQ